jgi:UDP-N-acetylglucosamine--N-acetylmuramyl-(pentapeptide) pyrophosphoryl-undecaprenol N-acetylglucosamine transferase
MNTAVLIMAGGTGGHVFPALAVAELLRERECRVVWVGTRRGLEARIVPAKGFAIEWLSVSGLRGKGLITWILAPVQLAIALSQAFMIVWRQKPTVVLGVGGFATGPGGLAAWLLRRPLVIHEQNAIAGLTNRWLARLARLVLEGFPNSFPPGIATRCIGNPVRREITGLAAPESRFAVRGGPVRLLVVGGSLGAQRLNTSVPRALALLQRQGHRFDVWHQAGARGIDAARAEYSLAGVTGRLDAFIDDMAAAYGWADLVICRAGALTVAELAAAGVGAILVPFPFAVDDHQTHNAQFLTSVGAAVLITDRDFEPARVAAALTELAGDRLQLLEMARRARTRAMPHAAESLTRAVLDVAGHSA